MVTVTMSEGASFFHEADEWLPATLARVEEGDDYGYGPTIRFILLVDGDVNDETGEQRETWAMASQKLTPRSKLYGWIKGIDASLIPDDGGTINLADLEGRRVDVMFEHGTKDDGTAKETVAKLRPSKVEAPADPAPTAADKETPF
jgi:hypothetical protein